MADGPMIEIKLTGRLGQQIAPRPSPVDDQKRQDQETGRRAAQEFAMEALHGMVGLMRHSPDPQLRFKAQKEILDRAWGKSKPLTEAEKQGEDAASILDILAGVSRSMTLEEAETSKQKLIESTPEDMSYFDVDAILVEVEQEADK